MVMKDNNREKEKKVKFNIIDLLIIVFIILSAVGIFLRYNLADEINFNATGDTFEIEFAILNIQEASQDYIISGEKFHINTDSIEIGTIKEILEVRNPALFYDFDKFGNITKTEAPGRIDVRGVMISNGRTTDDGFMINGNSFVAPNKEFYVHTGKWEGQITVISVTKISK